MAYLAPQQNPIAPILPVPRMALAAEVKDEIRGFENAFAVFKQPKVAKPKPAVPVALVLSIKLCCSRTLSGGSTDCRNSMGRLSPRWTTSGI
jgi:hypothetical protein